MTVKTSFTAVVCREYVAGVGLQNQEFSVAAGREADRLNVSSRVRGPVFLYELPSSIGSSPHPCHWTKMLSLYGHKFGEVCPSLVTW